MSHTCPTQGMGGGEVVLGLRCQLLRNYHRQPDKSLNTHWCLRKNQQKRGREREEGREVSRKGKGGGGFPLQFESLLKLRCFDPISHFDQHSLFSAQTCKFLLGFLFAADIVGPEEDIKPCFTDFSVHSHLHLFVEALSLKLSPRVTMSTQEEQPF